MVCSVLRAQDQPVGVDAVNNRLPEEGIQMQPVASDRHGFDGYSPDDDDDATYLGALNDSLHMPTLDMLGHRPIIGLYPLMGWGLSDWNHQSSHDAGINAVVGYMFNPNWEAYLYAQKSLTHSKMPMPLYYMGDMGDRIGAAVKYNFNPSVSVELNVEYHDFPHDPFRPFPHYWPK